MKHGFVVRLALMAGLTSMAMACGSPSSQQNGSSGQGISVSIEPTGVTLQPAATAGFASQVSGAASTAVDWSVQEVGGGSVNASGVYTAPATTGTFHVVVSSRVDPTRQATATITVAASQVATPVIFPSGGTFTSAQSVTVTCATPGAAIHYTTDGSTPTASSPAYAGAFTVTSTTTVQAIAIASGPVTSTVASSSIVISGAQVTGKFLGGFFPISIFGQVAGRDPNGQIDIEVWKNLGVNTAYGIQGPSWPGQIQHFRDTCRSLGLKQIRQPFGATAGTPPRAGDYSGIATDPDRPVSMGGTGDVIAWTGVFTTARGTEEWDELEYTMHQLMGVSGPDTWAYVNSVVSAIRAQDPVTPVTLNSGIITYATAGAFQDGWSYAGLGVGDTSFEQLFRNVDWYSNDIYPWGGSRYNNASVPNGNNDAKGSDGFGAADAPGRVMHNLANLANLSAPMPKGGNRAPMACIEAGDVMGSASSPGGPGGAYPSAGGFRAMIWGAITEGVRGVHLFAQLQGYPPGYNVTGLNPTPGTLAAEVKTQTSHITEIASVLQDVVDPAGVSCSAGAPLRAGWRSDGSGVYFIVVNTSADTLPSAAVPVSGVSGAATVLWESRSIGPSGSVITDSFGPYEVHVYRFAAVR
jgi:hypothetical protein